MSKAMKAMQRVCGACQSEGYLAAPNVRGTVTIHTCDNCGRFETDTEAECHALQRHSMGDWVATETLKKCTHTRINDA